MLLLAFELVEASEEEPTGPFAVLLLALALLHTDDDAGGFVLDLDGGGDLVDVLAAGALAGGGEFLDVILPVDLDGDFGGLGEDGDGGGGGMDAPLGFRGGDAFDAVDAGFEVQLSPCAVAADARDGGADAPDLGLGGHFDELKCPAAAGGVLLVHVDQVAGPEGGFGTAGSGPELHHERGDRLVVGGDEPGEEFLGDARELLAHAGEFIGREGGKVLLRTGHGGVEFGGFALQGETAAVGGGDGLELAFADGEVAYGAVVGEDGGVLESVDDLTELGVESREAGGGPGGERVVMRLGHRGRLSSARCRGVVRRGRGPEPGVRRGVYPACQHGPIGGGGGVSSNQAAVDIRGVRKTFGPKVAVAGLDLVVPAGKITGFIGPNGAGKTTTIRMIMSIIFPDRGSLSVLGKASALESKDRIGYLPEERGLYKKMKVGPFIEYMARLKGMDSAGLTPKVREWLGRLGLGDCSKKKCEELSKGMSQKVQFISSVIHEPDLLILDEPFSGLDPVNRRLLRELIDEQHKRGCTIIFSTHAMFEAEQLCDHLFMIHRGEKVLDLPMDEVWRRYDPRTIVAEPMTGGVEELSVAARGWAGVRDVRTNPRSLEVMLHDTSSVGTVMESIAKTGGFRRIELKRPSLEDIFIELVGGNSMSLAELEAQEAEVAHG